MLFSSVTFLFCFLPLSLLIYGITPRSWANAVLLVASLVFYACPAPGNAWLLLTSIVFNWIAGLTIEKTHSRRAKFLSLTLAVAANLSALAFFKYFELRPPAIPLVSEFIPIPAPGQRSVFHSIPVGISFFTFHAISYLVDIYRGEATAFANPLGIGLYLSFFPQLISGPIARFKLLAPQIRARTVTLSRFSAGAERFLFGLGKKLLIADPVGAAADHVFALPLPDLSTSNAWFGLLAYSLQIYFDFSGYSDMAIGLGQLFGFELPENFNYPYASRSVREFWRRWHITLSLWFRDYVYIPLGGSRGSKWGVAARLFLVFFLCGWWHGNQLSFVLWGLWHGLFLSLERSAWGAKIARAPALAARTYTILVVMAGWVLFRSPTLFDAAGFYATLLGLRSGPSYGHAILLYHTAKTLIPMAVGILLTMPIFPWLCALNLQPLFGKMAPEWAYGLRVSLALLVFILSSSFAASQTYHPFLYFQF